MKRKNLIQSVLMAALAAALLTACGSSSKYAGTNSQAYETAAAATYDYGGEPMISNGVAVLNEMAEAEEAYDTAGIELQEGGIKEQQDALAGRKLIKNVDMSVETEEYDALIPALENQVASLGGYIEEMSVSNRIYHYTNDMNLKNMRSAYMTARIPKENLDAFVSAVAQQSNVVRRYESVTDVTLQYVDLESHKKALSAEQDRLLELMEKAETVEDIITIEGRLSEVRYQLESMESQLRTFDNKIDYSTVNISIDEVEIYSPNETTSAWQRISVGFMNSLRGVGRGISNFVIWFIIHLPYIVVWAVIIVVIILIIRAVRRSMSKRRNVKGKKGRKNPYEMQGPQQNNPYVSNNVQKEQSANSVENEAKSGSENEGTDENNAKDDDAEG